MPEFGLDARTDVAGAPKAEPQTERVRSPANINSAPPNSRMDSKRSAGEMLIAFKMMASISCGRSLRMVRGAGKFPSAIACTS